MKRLKKEECSEETTVAAAQAAVAPAFAQEELCREQTAVAVWRTAVASSFASERTSAETKPRSR